MLFGLLLQPWLDIAYQRWVVWTRSDDIDNDVVRLGPNANPGNHRWYASLVCFEAWFALVMVLLSKARHGSNRFELKRGTEIPNIGLHTLGADAWSWRFNYAPASPRSSEIPNIGLHMLGADVWSWRFNVLEAWSPLAGTRHQTWVNSVISEVESRTSHVRS